MNNQIIGINEENLEKLILEIYDYRDRISKLFTEYTIVIEESKKYYNSKDGKEVRKKFKKISENFDSVLKNICVISEDFQSVLNNYQNNIEANVAILNYDKKEQ